MIIVNEIAPNMSSYLFLTFILLFGGSILIAATLDFLGLGPSQVMSLGLMMNTAVSNAALQLGYVVVVHPAGDRDHRDRRRPLRDERRSRRGLQPEAARAHEPRGRQPPRLLPHPHGRRPRARRRQLHGRRRRDHGSRRRVGLRQDDARQEPHPARRADARRRGARSQLDGVELPIGDDDGDERVPLPRGVDRPAVRDERAQPDPQDRADDLGAARLARRLATTRRCPS